MLIEETNFSDDTSNFFQIKVTFNMHEHPKLGTHHIITTL